MPFEPKHLLNFERGLYAAKEPWLSPETAFQVLRNARLDRGRVVKRKGYTPFGYLGIPVTAETDFNFDGGTADTFGLDHYPVRPPAWISDSSDTYCVEATDGSYTAKGWRDSYSGHSGSILMFQRVTLTLGAGATNYAGTLKGANNPRTPITFNETGGTTQEIVIDYISGPQYGPDAPVQGVTDASDADPLGTNEWTPASSYSNSGSYDVTFSATTVGSVQLHYDHCIGIIAITNGLCVFTYPSGLPWANTPPTIDYEYMTEEPVMGIYSWYTLDGDGVEYLVACDTDKIWKWNEATGNFVSPLGSFNGTDSDYFHFCPWEDFLVLNNGVDAPQKYTPATPAIAAMGVIFHPTTSEDIEAAKFCFRHHNRLVYVGTKEGSDWYLNRARWTPVNDVEFANATDDVASCYADANTSDRLVAAAQIGNEIVAIFGTSVWHLRYTESDAYNAFVWEQLPAMEGTASPFGFVNLGDAILYRGQEGINLTDASGVQAADLEIPDEVLQWNNDAREYGYGIYVPSEHEALLLYADQGDTYSERALVAHLDRDRKFKGWSKYDLPFHCLGKYRSGAVLSWDEAVAGYTVDELPFGSLDSLVPSIGFPLVLAGDRNGIIYQYADGYADDGEDVELTIRTIRLNPYPGRQCHLGWIDITADAIVDGSLTLTAYRNYQSAPHTGATVDLSASGESSKVSQRVRINKIAHFHTVQIVVKSIGPFALDAITLWCKPAGLARQIT